MQEQDERKLERKGEMRRKRKRNMERSESMRRDGKGNGRETEKKDKIVWEMRSLKKGVHTKTAPGTITMPLAFYARLTRKTQTR